MKYYIAMLLGFFLEAEQGKQESLDNDPLGQTHSLASSENCFLFVLFG